MNGTASRVATGRATLLVALSACGFGTIAIMVTLATRSGAALLNVLTWRYAIATAVLGAMSLTAGKLRFDGDTLKAAVYAGLGQAVVAVVSLSALRYIPAATLAFLFYSFPAWVAVIARVRHSEPLTPLRLLALALSLAGIFVTVGSPGGVSLHPFGVALALGAAVLYAAYIPMLGELQRNLPPLAMATCMAAGSTVFLGSAAAFRGELSMALPPVAWYAVFVLSLVSTVAAFVGFLAGLRVLGSVRTAIVSTVEPFFTALVAAALLEQPLTPSTVIGGALIATAVVLLQLKRAQNGSGAA
jgi:drug/metabolite transporter (DMT)-like permease